MKKILVVDDEFLIRYTLEEGLKDRGYDAKSAGTIEEAVECVKKFHPNVVILDNLLEHSVGMDEIATFKNMDEDIQVILMTAYGSVSQAVEATKRGAYDYVLKPFDVDEIDFIIKRCLEQMKRRDSLEFLKGKSQDFTGISEAVCQIRSQIKVLGENSSVNVLIRGETGTGKEVVARQIHDCSDRRENLMVRINCGAIPENLLESELFGYEKGAFAGALKTKKGLIELANGGTVFLDEIGELPLAMQTKLLTFLDDRKYKRIGGLEDIELDVRVIAATNRNLERAIAQGQFREDLFYRLNVMQIVIPPLRERREDIPALCDYYLDYYNKSFAKNIERVEPDFMRELILYDWKGNVRELKNIFERCFLFSQGNVLEKHVELTPVEKTETGGHGNCYYLKDLEKGPISLEQEVLVLEKLYMNQALKISNNNLTKAAALLGTTRFFYQEEDGEGGIKSGEP
ncbi:sigma-54-dependent transcriptional regulator [[Clostridium] symbiosum]|uniref:sigma-54-dependent transcriptional regulator n=1 Tax=Clostridium symbiosum TaxID=1512 RepID=UPI0001FAC2C0|nr:sigma-54 dependent transcriptional regulator [[Clostridium] symbiosum]EGB20377.1 Sigma-54 interaction domain protein [[Clostridium] symbiosum WAL-14673]